MFNSTDDIQQVGVRVIYCIARPILSKHFYLDGLFSGLRKGFKGIITKSLPACFLSFFFVLLGVVGLKGHYEVKTKDKRGSYK